MTNKISIPDAIAVVRAELGKDKSPGSYWYSWQHSIATSFTTEYKERIGEGCAPIDHHAVIITANEAAKNFLNLLCTPNEFKTENNGEVNRTV